MACLGQDKPSLERRWVCWHVQAWCEAGVGDVPMDTDVDTDAGDWLAETSESQSHAVAPSMRQLAFTGLDTVQEVSSEGTPTSAPTQHGTVRTSPETSFQEVDILLVCVILMWQRQALAKAGVPTMFQQHRVLAALLQTAVDIFLQASSNGAAGADTQDTDDSSSGVGFWQKRREQTDTAQTITSESGIQTTTAGLQAFLDLTHFQTFAAVPIDPAGVLSTEMNCGRDAHSEDREQAGCSPADAVHTDGVLSKDPAPSS